MSMENKLGLFVILGAIGLACFWSGAFAEKVPNVEPLPLKGTACYTNWWFKGNASDAWQSVIQCPVPIGSVSVEQLYAKGWRVVSVSLMSDTGSYYAVIIETQGR
jgi:hypothetical protein